MSVYNVLYVELKFNNENHNKSFFENFEKRKLLDPIVALKEVLAEVLDEDIDFDDDRIEYFDVISEDKKIKISVEGNDADTIIKDLAASLNSYIDTLFFIQYFEYEYYFGALEGESVNCNFGKFSDDFFEDELEKESPSKVEIFRYLFERYESGALVEKKINLEEIFLKISDVSIDPIDDGYYFNIKNRCEIGSNGESILTWAIKNKNVNLVSQILQDGDPEPALIMNDDGKSALDVAQELGDADLIEIISSVL